MSEPQFTLAEARRELSRRECAAYGHDLDYITKGMRPAELLSAVCGRCHRRWTMTEVTT